MKKILTLLTTLFLILTMSFTTLAADANVTYSGDAGEFVFAPGSGYSLTDLFPNFKDVMPGDSISQKITVRNLASNKVKVKIYMRSLGAHEDGESPDFLSQMHLTVKKSEDNTMPHMFEAAANETAQLTDWVCLGTLYSGGEVNLDVILDVPMEMDNNYAKKIGYLDWEFKIEEFPIEDSDPQTGDGASIYQWIGVAGLSAIIIFVVILRRKSTKIALALSIGLLMLWALLGTGTTIAWFTDISATQKNTFYVGDLDLVVSYKTEDGTYEEIDSDTTVFDDEALYEPGYVQVVYLKVENQGDVPFEYKLSVDVDDVTVAMSVLGNEIYLPDYLKYGVLFAADEMQLTRETAKVIAKEDFPENTMDYPLNVYTEKDNVVLQPGAERYVAIIVHMPESVGNVANYRGLVIPKVGMGITVYASQEGTLK